jgi:hypothetical protein
MQRFGSLFMVAALAVFARAEEPAAPAAEAVAAPQADMQFDLLVVTVPDAKAMELLPLLRDPAQVEKACASLQALMEKKEAQMVAWPTLIASQGQRSVVEMVKEIRYASEFGDGTQPVPVPAPGQGAAVGGGVVQGNGAPAAGDKATNAKIVDAPLYPTAFETRNAGITLELESTMRADGKSMEVAVTAGHVHFSGMGTITVTMPNRAVTVEQPQFVTNNVNTHLVMTNGDRVLLGNFPAPGKPEWTELLILKAVTRPLRK